MATVVAMPDTASSTLAPPTAQAARSIAATSSHAHFDFPKQPISPPPSSDTDALSSDGHEQPRHVSLLSSMLASPKSGASSSGPSTALSSPRAVSDPVSILRRSSFGSDGGEPFRLPLARAVSPGPAVMLKLHPSQVSDTEYLAPVGTTAPSIEGSATVQRRRSSLKFAVANRPVLDSRQKFQGYDDKVLQDDEDEDEDEEEEAEDEGYIEDSEDGDSDVDEEDDERNQAFLVKAHRFGLESQPLAPCITNSTSASTRSPSQSPTRSAAEDDRGRQHVRMDPAAGRDHKRVSRHFSPPPASPSDAPAPPGPRDGRCGSPVPKHIDLEDEDEDEDSQDQDQSEEESRITTESLVPEEGISTTDSDDVPSQAAIGASLGSSGVRTILRRASEHLPGFRRPSFAFSSSKDEATSAVTMLDSTSGSVSTSSRSIQSQKANGGLGRARSLGSRTPALRTPQISHMDAVSSLQALHAQAQEQAGHLSPGSAQSSRPASQAPTAPNSPPSSQPQSYKTRLLASGLTSASTGPSRTPSSPALTFASRTGSGNSLGLTASTASTGAVPWTPSGTSKIGSRPVSRTPSAAAKKGRPSAQSSGDEHERSKPMMCPGRRTDTDI